MKQFKNNFLNNRFINHSSRQSIPAFRMREKWMIDENFN